MRKLAQGTFTLLVLCWANAYLYAGSFSKTYSHQVSATSNKLSSVWHEDGTFPFNELIVSWNALRPKSGKYTIYTRVKGKRWSNWIKSAEWGAGRQQSFSYTKDEVAQLEINCITLKRNALATAFEVKVDVSGGADLGSMRHLYACASNLNKYGIIKPSRNLRSGVIEHVLQQSQMVLKHSRARDMCSPTATSTVVSYLLGRINDYWAPDNGKELRALFDAVDFAALAHDDTFDLYGNWVLNVAAAYDISGGKVPCRVERLASFDALHQYLLNDRPVVVSVQGPLRGSALPYAKGHLMVVIGWDAQNQLVCCIDSAFGSNKRTKVWYHSDDFLKAWGRRKNLSYVFMPLS